MLTHLLARHLSHRRLCVSLSLHPSTPKPHSSPSTAVSFPDPTFTLLLSLCPVEDFEAQVAENVNLTPPSDTARRGSTAIITWPVRPSTSRARDRAADRQPHLPLHSQLYPSPTGVRLHESPLLPRGPQFGYPLHFQRGRPGRR